MVRDSIPVKGIYLVCREYYHTRFIITRVKMTTPLTPNNYTGVGASIIFSSLPELKIKKFGYEDW